MRSLHNTRLLIQAGLVLICFILGFMTRAKVFPCKIKKETIIERDTVFRNMDFGIVRIPKPKLIREDLRLYHDTIIMGGVKLTYEHEVKGFLNNSKYSISYGQSIVNKKTTYSMDPRLRVDLLTGIQIIDKKPTDFLIGLGIGLNRFSYSYQYGVFENSHNVGLGIRLYQK